MIFEYTDLKPRNPHFSLAMEEAFCYFLARENPLGYKGGLRLWSNPPSVILGRTCKMEENLSPSIQTNFFEHKSPIPVCRRLSGGGTVCHGPGNLNYSIYLDLARWPKLYNVTYSYEVLLSLVAEAVQVQGFSVKQRGQSDLVLVGNSSEFKFSGNSQFRKYGFLCLHGTLITSPSLIREIKQYLKHPPKEPDYRQGRSHGNFLGALPSEFEIAQFFYSLKQGLQDLTQVRNLRQLDSRDKQMVYGLARTLMRQVYTNPDWIEQGKGTNGRQFLEHPHRQKNGRQQRELPKNALEVPT